MSFAPSIRTSRIVLAFSIASFSLRITEFLLEGPKIHLLDSLFLYKLYLYADPPLILPKILNSFEQ